MFILFYLNNGVSEISGVTSGISGLASGVSRVIGIVSGVVLNSINRAISCYELNISFTKK